MTLNPTQSLSNLLLEVLFCCVPVRQEFMENECEALPGVAYPGVRDNRSTLNTKTGYDDDDVCKHSSEFNVFVAPCGLRGCKNGPAPFPGRMSYKATKPGLAVCHILACFYCIVVY